jgi:hypothetical protein
MLTTNNYDGVPCFRVKTARIAVALERLLHKHGKSYKTKITRTKKRGIEYIVLVYN